VLFGFQTLSYGSAIKIIAPYSYSITKAICTNGLAQSSPCPDMKLNDGYLTWQGTHSPLLPPYPITITVQITSLNISAPYCTASSSWTQVNKGPDANASNLQGTVVVAAIGECALHLKKVYESPATKPEILKFPLLKKKIDSSK